LTGYDIYDIMVLAKHANKHVGGYEMKELRMANGQIFEIYETQKEITEMVKDNYINNADFLDDDFSVYIEYKNGSNFFMSATEKTGKFKTTGIKSVVENNPCTTSVFGEYEIVKTDTDDTNDDCCYTVI